MKIAVAAFCKTIGLSPVKTRIEADLEKEVTQDFYRRSIDCIERVLIDFKTKVSNDGNIYLAVPEEDSPILSGERAIPGIWCGTSGLGDCMCNISNKLLKENEAVILIGTDSPQLTPDILLSVMKKLQGKSNNCVIGPSFDGGFYLLGITKPIPRKIWNNVTYSRNDTRKQFMESLQKEGFQCSFLPYTSDADTKEDLYTVLHELEMLDNKKNKEQEELAQWLKRRLEDENKI